MVRNTNNIEPDAVFGCVWFDIVSITPISYWGIML